MAQKLSEGQLRVLPLFESCDASAYGPAKGDLPELNDVLIHCGGAIWAMDWCPAAGSVHGSEATLQYLAVGDSLIGTPLDGVAGPCSPPARGDLDICISVVALVLPNGSVKALSD